MYDDDEDLDALDLTIFETVCALAFLAGMLLAGSAFLIALVWYFFSSTAGA